MCCIALQCVTMCDGVLRYLAINHLRCNEFCSAVYLISVHTYVYIRVYMYVCVCIYTFRQIGLIRVCLLLVSASCNTLQHATIHCNTLQYIAIYFTFMRICMYTKTCKYNIHIDIYIYISIYVFTCTLHVYITYIYMCCNVYLRIGRRGHLG